MGEMMMHSFAKMSAVMIAACGLLAPAYGATGPVGAALTLDSVVGTCETVANSTPDGSCVSATGSYLGSLTGTPSAIDQQATDLVLQLVPLATANRACNAVDDEIAQAVRQAASYVTNPAQRTRMLQIASSVGACGDVVTSDIVVPSPNA